MQYASKRQYSIISNLNFGKKLGFINFSPVVYTQNMEQKLGKMLLKMLALIFYLTTFPKLHFSLQAEAD